ncbi:hypothetical protein [Oceanobacillus jordanicus]|uniref:BshB3 potential contributor to bacillithiol synthesis n=1 Tax=Oceanobacillus jordanicus TaxID=2867266 RepID=A0AAW5B581_9BACI|nr:hypothetical protein [Oceanobacillus jordanicus]MCG3419650.1 hypothetical protein [Oceanobacillus jordanicus]
MKLAITLVVITTLIGLVLTILQIGKSDSDYDSKSKKNVKRLTLIYVVTILASLIALAIFVFNYTS